MTPEKLAQYSRDRMAQAAQFAHLKRFAENARQELQRLVDDRLARLRAATRRCSCGSV
jgi:hypothetical protein